MTIKDLSNAAGCNERTVRRIAGDLYPGLIKKGVKTVFNKDQAYEIMGFLPKKNMVQMSEEHGTNVRGVDYEAIGKMIGMAVTAALKPVVDELKDVKKIAMLPAPVNEDFYSLAAYCNVKSIKVNRSEMAMHGKYLKRIASEKGIEIHSIPDERWGKVNSYPVEILDEYFFSV